MKHGDHKIWWGCGEGIVIDQSQELATRLSLWDCGQLSNPERPDVGKKGAPKGITIQVRPELNYWVYKAMDRPKAEKTGTCLAGFL